MGNQAHRGWQRLRNAAGYSWAGLQAAWRHEEAFRQEGLLCAALVPAALWLGGDAVERVLLIGSLLLVMIVELLNTGLESAIDRIGPQWHDLSKRCKDLGSAAVLLSIVLSLGIWIAALAECAKTYLSL